jgi:hypothetical protein
MFSLFSPNYLILKLIFVIQKKLDYFASKKRAMCAAQDEPKVGKVNYRFLITGGKKISAVTVPVTVIILRTKFQKSQILKTLKIDE